MGQAYRSFGVFIFLFSIQIGVSALTLLPEIKNGTSVPFLKFSGPGPWDSYLSMNLPYEPMKDLLKQFQSKENIVLKNRGEAHITVVTPVEYWNQLRPLAISMEEIHEIAASSKIQSSVFKVTCLGEGKAVVQNKELRTYFVVVQSEDLISIRKQILNLVMKKGGSVKNFDPNSYYPHITMGFTEMDLHESHGVKKDKTACIAPL